MILLFFLLILFFGAGYVVGYVSGRGPSPFRTVVLWVVGVGFAYLVVEVFGWLSENLPPV